MFFRARYVFPVVSEPIADGWVAIEDGRIVGVGRGRAGGDVHDLGNVAILPGLVNTHVHLDFSDLDTPIGHRGIGFVDWIRRVIEFRITGMASPANTEHPVVRGIRESLRHGVTSLGDITQAGWPQQLLPSPDANLRSVPGEGTVLSRFSTRLNVTLFQELIAPTPDRIPEALELADAHLSLCVPPSHSSHLHTFTPALSPHAPYSVHPDLLASVVARSASEKFPVAMHLAESREEMELLRNGTGPFRTFLDELGVWNALAMRPNTRPLDYLQRLAAAHRSLIVHGTYLDDEEQAFLAGKSDRMAVVYCPRTHDWFDRGAYPLAKMLDAGVTVALGTDGRGSSPDLSLLSEMRFAARRHPEVLRHRLLRMGTLDGAKALGWQQHLGSLEPGKQADLTMVALPNREADDPHALLLDSDETVVGCGTDVLLH